MNINQIRIVLRDLKNKLTGKQDIIDEYNMLVGFLTGISDMARLSPEQKKQIADQLNKITESKPIYSGHATVVYNPSEGARRTTIAKISQLYDIKTRIDGAHDIQKYWAKFCREYQR